MVHADAHGGVVLAADVDEAHQPLVNPLQLGLVFLVGVFQVFERAGGVDVVAGVDAHLLAVAGSHVGHVGVEVHVGHQRRRVAVGPQPPGNVLHVQRFAAPLGGEAHQLAAGIDDALGLLHAAFSVVGVDGGHRLHADGVVAADVEAAHVGHRANSSYTHISLRSVPR